MMKWKRILAACLCALAAAVAGCSDDTDGGGGGGGASFETYEDFQDEGVDEIVSLYCSAVFDCPEKQSPSFVLALGRFENKQACLDGAKEEMGFGTSSRQTAAIEAGRTVFDPSAASNCIQLLSQASSQCQPIGELQSTFAESDCDALLVGQQEDGEYCNSGDECASGFCDQTQDFDTCYGVCAPQDELPGEGESCYASRCAQGLSCDYSGDDDICVAHGSREEGESCNGSGLLCADGLVCGLSETCIQPPTYVTQGESCSPTGGSFCEPGLVCADMEVGSDQTVTGTCEPPRAQGEACQNYIQCAIGLFCDTDGESQEGTCEPPKQEGDSCTGDQGECGDDLWCNTSGETAQCASSGGNSSVCEIPEEDTGADAGSTDDTADAG
jgi:hypothetical protein